MDMRPRVGVTIRQLRLICLRMPPDHVWRRIPQRISWRRTRAASCRNSVATWWARNSEANQGTSIMLVQPTPGMTLKLSLANLNDAWFIWLPTEQRNEIDWDLKTMEARCSLEFKL